MKPTMNQIDAAAKALRDHDMKGRITRAWCDLPHYDKKKWWKKAELALEAANATKGIEVHKTPA